MSTSGSVTVTVMFTDLVGSTELLARLGGDADALRRAHFVALRRALAATDGEEIKSLGDGLMAVFRSTVDAIDCGVAMQQAISRLAARNPDITLAIRVGISVGEGTQEGDDWFGTPVVEAARLCDAADGGQTLASDRVVELARSRTGHRFASVGALNLKGLAPLATSEVHWQSTGAVPFPSALERRDRPYFVGRDRARAQLDAAWGRARTGTRQGVFVCGEPGIGKTTLMSETSRVVHGQGGTVLYGRCEESLGVAYQPFAEAMRGYVADCALEQLSAHAAVHSGELTRLVPELARRLPDLPPPSVVEPEADRLRLFEAVQGLLTLASQEAPVLVVLDDLHWAGKPTLLLLWHLLRADDGAAVLVAGTYRDTEPGRNQPLAQLLSDLRRQQGIEYLTLSGLDQAGVDAFLEAAAGHRLDANGLALARLLRVETDGNPFFVSEVLRHLVETGALAKRDGTWRVERDLDQIGIPEGVRDVVNGRLSRLSEPAHRALTVGSVIGAEFTLDVVERVQNGNGSGTHALLDGLDEALRTRLILEPAGAPGQYAFAHALVRQTLYEGLTGTRRARMHWRVAEALEARHGESDGPHLAALAHHFVEAVPLGPTDKAAEYALRASRWALGQVAYEQAAVVLERGLQALARDARPDESLRCELLLAVAQCRAQALDFAGMREASLDAAAAARAAGSAEGMAQAAVWYNARPIAGARDDVGIRLCEEALDSLGDTQPGVRAVILATMVLHLSFAGEGIGVDARSRKALALAESTADPVAMAMANMARYYAIWGSPRAAEQLTLAEYLMSSPVITPSGFRASYDAHRLRAIARMILGDRRGFEADAAEVERLGKELRSRYYLACAAQWRATLALLDGRFDQVEELTSLQLTHAGEDQNFLNSFAAQILQLHLEQGRAAELKPMVVDVVERNPGIPGFRAALAVALVELDELDEARRELETLAPDRFAVMPRDLVWPATMTLLTEVCVALDDREHAAILYELFEPYTGLLVVTGGGSFCPGAVDRYLGMLTACLGRLTESETLYRSALELEERVSSPPLVARTRYWYGRALLDRGGPGDREEAMALSALALETAETLGMKGLAARVRSAATHGTAGA